MSQEDLFGGRLIGGLTYFDDFLGLTEEEELLARLNALDLAPFRFHQWAGKRRTRTYGWRYDFEDSSFTPADPIPEWLRPLQLKAAHLTGIAPDDFAHVLLARYDPGAGIGWHRDRPQFEQVFGISLGSAAVMRFRRRTDGGFARAKLNLAPRSAYLLSGPSRWDWQHSIAPGEKLRYSLTFRTLSTSGRRIAAQQD